MLVNEVGVEIDLELLRANVDAEQAERDQKAADIAAQVSQGQSQIPQSSRPVPVTRSA